MHDIIITVRMTPCCHHILLVRLDIVVVNDASRQVTNVGRTHSSLVNQRCVSKMCQLKVCLKKSLDDGGHVHVIFALVGNMLIYFQPFFFFLHHGQQLCPSYPTCSLNALFCVFDGFCCPSNTTSIFISLTWTRLAV